MARPQFGRLAPGAVKEPPLPQRSPRITMLPREIRLPSGVMVRSIPDIKITVKIDKAIKEAKEAPAAPVEYYPPTAPPELAGKPVPVTPVPRVVAGVGPPPPEFLPGVGPPVKVGKVWVRQSQLIEAGKLTGEAQFDKYVELGIIEKGSKFVEGVDGWSYYPAKQWKKVEEFGEKFVREAPERKAIRVSQAEYRKWKAAEARLKDYRMPLKAGIPREAQPVYYDVVKAVQEGKVDAVRVLFGDAVLKDTRLTILALRLVKPYTDKEGRIDVVKAMQEGVRDSAFLTLGFTPKELKQIKHEAKGYIVSPVPEDTEIPKGFPSDKAYAKLSFREKMALLNKGDLRPLYGVTTWYAGLEAQGHQKLWKTQLKDIKQDELMELIAAPYARVAAETRRIPEKIVTKDLSKIIRGVAAGLGDVGVSAALTPVIIGALPSMAISGRGKEALATTTAVGTGIYGWGKDTVVNVVRDPFYGIAYAIITLGPMAYTAGRWGISAAKRVVVYVHPKGIPMELAAVEYSTGRIPVGKYPTVDLGKAVGEALREAARPRAKASGEVTVKGITVRYIRTPFQQEIGNSLWHGSGDMNFITRTGRLKVKPEGLYLNPYLAEHYATGKNSGYVLLLTDTTKFREVPSKALKGITQSDWYIRQTEAGLFEPSKLWHGDFETELVLKGTMEVPPPKAGLFQRLFMGKAGDYFTFSNRQGKFQPISIAYDKAVFRTAPTSAELYAIKLHLTEVTLRNFAEAVKHPGRSLRDIVTGRPGPKGLREMEISKVDLMASESLQRILLDLRHGAKKVADAKAKPGSLLWDKAYDKAYTQAFTKAMNKLKKQYSKLLETAYTKDRQAFESIYLYNMDRIFRAYARNRIVTRRAREAQSIVREDWARRSPELRKTRPERVIEGVRYPSITTRSRPRIRPERGIFGIRMRPVRPVRPVRPGEPFRPFEPPETVRLERELLIRPPKEPIKPPIRPVIRPRRKPDMSDKTKRKLISQSKGAFTFRMGELGKEKDVWYTYVEPYSKPEHRIVVVGKAPRGALIVRGPGSAIKTAQMLYGKALKEKRTDDIGFMDAIFEPIIRRKGIRLSFKPDPKGETIGDFGVPFRISKVEAITPRAGSITDRRARLSSGRGIRITPKTPSLR